MARSDGFWSVWRPISVSNGAPGADRAAGAPSAINFRVRSAPVSVRPVGDLGKKAYGQRVPIISRFFGSGSSCTGVDLSDELWGPVFEPLKDPAYFRRFEIAEYGTIAWPNGADLAPEFLYSRAHVAA